MLRPTLIAAGLLMMLGACKNRNVTTTPKPDDPVPDGTTTFRPHDGVIPDLLDPDDNFVSDWSDEPYSPTANHHLHRWEWIGYRADEENQPRPFDKHDDGVFVLNPRNLNPGDELILSIELSSRSIDDPTAFPGGSQGSLGVWIDWDYDDTFVDGERVYLHDMPFPLLVNGVEYDHYMVEFRTTVPAGFEMQGIFDENEEQIGADFPTIRARLVWSRDGSEQASSPGGAAEFGEVEDVAHPLSDLVKLMPEQGKHLVGKKLAIMRENNDGVMKMKGWENTTDEIMKSLLKL